MSDIEGKAARAAASECGQRASFNGANGMSDPAPAGPRRERSSAAGAAEIQWSEWDARSRCGGTAREAVSEFG